MKINFGLIAINSDGDVLHFCGYESKPSEHDINSLNKELREDKEFGIAESDFVVVDAPLDMIKEMFGEDNDTDKWKE